MLTDNALAAIDQLRGAPLLQAVGTSDGEGASVRVQTWAEALGHVRNVRWQNRRLAIREGYRQELMVRDREKWRSWNELVDELTPSVSGIMDEQITPRLPSIECAEDIANTINWDLLHLLIEISLQDVMPMGFYVAQGVFYIHGFFPCGWQGEGPPQGRPVIF